MTEVRGRDFKFVEGPSDLRHFLAGACKQSSGVLGKEVSRPCQFDRALGLM